MTNNDVMITGMGVVSPVATGVDDFYRALKEGRSGGVRIDQIEDEAGNLPLDLGDINTRVGAPVLDFDVGDLLSAKQIKRSTRPNLFTLLAAQEALLDAGYELEVLDTESDEGRYRISGENPERFGVLMGTNFGGIKSLVDNIQRMLEGGPRRVSPLTVPKMMSNRVSGELSIVFGLEGPSSVSVAACASSLYSLAMGASLLHRGQADVVVTGGTEAVLTPLVVAAFSRLKATTRNNDDPAGASRPFDAERDGFLPGEGAGVLVLETRQHAERRNAPLYAKLTGAGMTDDAHHMTAPDPSGQGAVRAMNLALEESGTTPEQIDYINAHGTSTPLNDRMETQAIKQSLGSAARDVAISSTKSQIGHLMGAAGAVETIACLLAIEHDFIPPTINYENPDPDCDLNYTPNDPIDREVNTALCNSFGFGGHNASVLVTAPDYEPTP